MKLSRKRPNENASPQQLPATWQTNQSVKAQTPVANVAGSLAYIYLRDSYSILIPPLYRLQIECNSYTTTRIRPRMDAGMMKSSRIIDIF